MHGMWWQLLKQTGSQELAQPAAKKQQHLEGVRAAGQACSPSHLADLCTSLQAQTQNIIGQHGEGDEGGSKVWRSFPASKDLCM